MPFWEPIGRFATDWPVGGEEQREGGLSTSHRAVRRPADASRSASW